MQDFKLTQLNFEKLLENQEKLKPEFSNMHPSKFDNFIFDKSNITIVFSKMNLSSTLWVGVYFTDEMKSFFFKGERNPPKTGKVEISLVEEIPYFSDLDKIWREKLGSNFPEVP